MEADFIPLQVSFGNDQLTNYVRKQRSYCHRCQRGRREDILSCLFWGESSTTMLCGEKGKFFFLKLFLFVVLLSPTLYLGTDIYVWLVSSVVRSDLVRGEDKLV